MSEQKKQTVQPAAVVIQPAPKAATVKAEMEAKPVKLHRPKEKDGKPADVIPVPPVAAGGPAPRLVHDNERAPPGLRRFAVHCNEPLAPKRYVLAKTQGEAEAHYRKYAGLDGQDLVVKPLAD